MGYSFMRIEKIKTFSGMNGLYKHNYRKMEVPNADINLSALNEEQISLNGKTYNEAFHDKINGLEYYKNHNIRKNAVLALEVVTSFSREDLAGIDLKKWQQDNENWLRATFNTNEEKYGNNVISMMIHHDEVGNVHCHSIVIPITEDGKLSARSLINGRQRFFELQDSYGKLMKENHNLSRGLHKSKATHEDIKHFYSEMNSSFYEKNPVPAITKEDSLESYKLKVEDYVKDLKGSQLREIKQLEKAKIEKSHAAMENAEKRNKYIKEKIIEYKDENKVLKKNQLELEHKFGSMEKIKEKLDYVENLLVGIETCPDQDISARLQEQINDFIEQGKQERKKYKKKEKKQKQDKESIER